MFEKDGREPPLGLKGNFGANHAIVASDEGGDASLVSEREQGDIDGVAIMDPRSLVVLQRRLVAQNAHLHEGINALQCRNIRSAARCRGHRTDPIVGLTRDVEPFAIRQQESSDGLAIDRQRPCFVTGDVRTTA